MNPERRTFGSFWDGLNREERREKGQRSGYQIPAKLSTKPNPKTFSLR